MGYSRSRPDPDGILCASLSGTADRLAQQGSSIADAIAELTALGRGRADLVAQAAGLTLGVASVEGRAVEWWRPVAAGLLLATVRTDPLEVQRWVDTGRERAVQRPNYDKTVRHWGSG